MLFSGFSVIPTMADEYHNPSRDVVIGMLSSILITVFIILAFVILIVPYFKVSNIKEFIHNSESIQIGKKLC
ncbi:hypothetical protein [Candidatus Sneabacter namystus]|uniref:Amino acid permease/ SLC12A domain-containing protein n=1 Tax=Candidatus Sneabacter namystus TaxID=2601646 RepID=A0A5C0UHS4_9RICK|nr:hypothetical protein [Candidatus Sneabacter namystus]QEK39735.1 hypothetical protein FZC37_02230 [Candidatus Sneabacter namystus]